MGEGSVMLCLVCLISFSFPARFLKNLCIRIHSVGICNCHCWKSPSCLQQVTEEYRLIHVDIG